VAADSPVERMLWAWCELRPVEGTSWAVRQLVAARYAAFAAHLTAFNRPWPVGLRIADGLVPNERLSDLFGIPTTATATLNRWDSSLAELARAGDATAHARFVLTGIVHHENMSE